MPGAIALAALSAFCAYQCFRTWQQNDPTKAKKGPVITLAFFTVAFAAMAWWNTTFSPSIAVCK